MLSGAVLSLTILATLSLSDLTLGRMLWPERNGRAVFLNPRRFEQEHPPVLERLSAACPGQVCGVLSGAAITPLLAAQPECSQQDMADKIIDESKQFDAATQANMLAIAKEYRQAEKNVPPDFSTQPPTPRNSVFCQKAAKHKELNCLVQAQDPANNPDLFFDPAKGQQSIKKGSQANTQPFCENTKTNPSEDPTTQSSSSSPSATPDKKKDSAPPPKNTDPTTQSSSSLPSATPDKKKDSAPPPKNTDPTTQSSSSSPSATPDKKKDLAPPPKSTDPTLADPTTQSSSSSPSATPTPSKACTPQSSSSPPSATPDKKKDSAPPPKNTDPTTQSSSPLPSATPDKKKDSAPPPKNTNPSLTDPTTQSSSSSPSATPDKKKDLPPPPPPPKSTDPKGTDPTTQPSSSLPSATPTPTNPSKTSTKDKTDPATDGDNLQKFTDSLGSPPPAVTKLANGQFQVDGNAAFKDLNNALARSCDVQKNKCSNAANSSGNKGDLTVAACETQHGKCIDAAKGTA